MKKIQFLIIALFLIGLNQKTIAQKYDYRAISLSVMDRDEKGNWSKWSDFKKSDIIITLDANKDRFIVYSRDIQFYKITAYMQKVTTENDETLGFQCEDIEGAKCMLMLVTRKKENNRKQFYINYPDLKMVYNLYSPKK